LRFGQKAGFVSNSFVLCQKSIWYLQLDISSSVVRQIVESRGAALSLDQHKNQICPDFTSRDCTQKTVIAGADGVISDGATWILKQFNIQLPMH